jgi:hypothetical protein
MVKSTIHARILFWAGKEVADDYIIVRDVTCFFHRGVLRLEFPSFIQWPVYFHGRDLIGNLDTKTKEQFKNKKTDYKFVADVLMVKEGTDKYREMFSRGFYHYNPHRAKPDSVLAVKITK